MDVVKASLDDVEAIRSLIEYHAANGKMLLRSLSYIYENIRDYFVVREDGEVLGCCALHVSWRDLAEVKSLAVREDRIGKGVGKALLEAALKEAREMGIPRVFTLTLEKDFFVRNGFELVPKDELPMKIWGECIYCPKYPDCDEAALIYQF
ncbi:MAG: N-acetyltransferase [Candidatus Altiarchaeales archaeon]|nr:N-acetyltransferase [Candidatus Altiarchaeales archaeon]MBD3416849.1 N-acetyltransferase [Candidatus Altiarchaeales archaeon]